jgi:hypothetical protein
MKEMLMNKFSEHFQKGGRKWLVVGRFGGEIPTENRIL